MNQLMLYIAMIVIVAFVAFCAAVLAQRSSFFARVLNAESAGHLHAVDGLRGMLAFAVFLHHAQVHRDAFVTHEWSLPRDPILILCGPGSVAIFFMITAFLFWSRALGGRISWGKFLVKRFFRLAPAYYFSISLLLFVAVAMTGFTLHSSVAILMREVSDQMMFGIHAGHTINGMTRVGVINAYVTWSLSYEWLFYLALPILATMATRRWKAVAPIVVAATLALLPRQWILLNFSFGMAAAHLMQADDLAARLKPYATSIGVGSLAILIAVALFLGPKAIIYGAPITPGETLETLLFFSIFVTVLLGNSFGGLLVSKPIRLLGTISYSVYLLHGIVLFSVLQALNRFTNVAMLSATAYFAVMICCSALVLLLAAFSYRYVEHPFIVMSTGRSLVETPRANAHAA